MDPKTLQNLPKETKKQPQIEATPTQSPFGGTLLVDPRTLRQSMSSRENSVKMIENPDLRNISRQPDITRPPPLQASLDRLDHQSNERKPPQSSTSSQEKLLQDLRSYAKTLQKSVAESALRSAESTRRSAERSTLSRNPPRPPSISDEIAKVSQEIFLNRDPKDYQPPGNESRKRKINDEENDYIIDDISPNVDPNKCSRWSEADTNRTVPDKFGYYQKATHVDNPGDFRDEHMYDGQKDQFSKHESRFEDKDFNRNRDLYSPSNPTREDDQGTKNDRTDFIDDRREVIDDRLYDSRDHGLNPTAPMTRDDRLVDHLEDRENSDDRQSQMVRDLQKAAEVRQSQMLKDFQNAHLNALDSRIKDLKDRLLLNEERTKALNPNMSEIDSLINELPPDVITEPLQARLDRFREIEKSRENSVKIIEEPDIVGPSPLQASLDRFRESSLANEPPIEAPFGGVLVVDPKTLKPKNVSDLRKNISRPPDIAGPSPLQASLDRFRESKKVQEPPIAAPFGGVLVLDPKTLQPKNESDLRNKIDTKKDELSVSCFHDSFYPFKRIVT